MTRFSPLDMERTIGNKPTSVDARQNRNTLATLALLAGLAIYGLAFFRQPLRDLPAGSAENGPPLRMGLWSQLLLVDEWLGQWVSPGFAGLDRLRIVAGSAAIVLAAASVGWLVLGLLGADRRLTRLESAVFSLGLGANLLSTYVLLMGLAGALRAAVLLPPLAIVIAVAGARWLWKLRRAQAAGPLAEQRPADRRANALESPLTLWRFWPQATIGIFGALIVLAGMLPPINFDVLEYHLQAPKEFYRAGHIEFLPHNIYGNMPLGAEMPSLLGMVLVGDWWLGGQAGKTVIALFAPLTALLLLAAGQRLASSRGASSRVGSVAATCYITIPWVALVSADGLVEGVSAYYLAAATYAWALWRQAESEPALARSRLLLAGLLAGAAVACKYPNVMFVVLPLAAAVAWVSVRRGKTAGTESTTVPRRWRPWLVVATFMLAAALGGGPWYAKNWVLTGNPTYPLFYSLFDGQTRTPEKHLQWQRAHRPPNFSGADLLSCLVGFGLTSSWLSPAVVPLAAYALVSRRQRRLALTVMGYLTFTLACWWLVTHRLERFWVASLPLAALLAGLGADAAEGRLWRWGLAGWLAIGFSYDLVALGSGLVADNRYFGSLDALRSEARQMAPAHIYLDEHVPRSEVALLVGDAEPYDIEAGVLYNTVFDDSLFEALAAERSPQSVARALSARHVSHVLVDWGEIARYRSPGNYGFTPFVVPDVFQGLVAADVLELVYRDDRGGEVYRVLPPQSPD